MNGRRWFVTVSACVLLLAALAGFKYFQIQAAIAYGASFPEPSETVRALAVTVSPSETYTSTIGEVIAPNALMLRNELQGRITTLNMVSGEQVSKGQLLLQLDATEEQARLQAARANATLIELNLKRLEKLLSNKTASQEEVDQAQAQYAVAQANIAELAAIVAKKTLTAPFDAWIGLHDLEVGEYLDANTALVELVGVSDFLWVDFHLPLAQGVLNLGDVIEVEPPRLSESAREAVIIAKDPTLSAESRNLRYRAKIPTESALPPHSVVKVLVPTGTQPQIHVPLAAVMRDELGAYVFRLDAEAEGEGYRAQRQSVQLGRERAEEIAILSGLAAGTMIATDGAFKLHHGMLAYIGDRPSAGDHSGESRP